MWVDVRKCTVKVRKIKNGEEKKATKWGKRKICRGRETKKKKRGKQKRRDQFWGREREREIENNNRSQRA